MSKKLVNKAKDPSAPVEERAMALLLLGDAFYTGKGAEKNVEKAFKCYLKAAIMGNPDAMYEAGQCYRYAIGVKANEAQAFY